jgi:hypothetical protein
MRTTRAYFFGNMYLSSIQQGIQAGHVIGEMSVQYYAAMDGGDSAGELFYHWANNDKTMILLNGGYGENLHELYDFMSHSGNTFPYAKFHESKAALDGALTSIGIILPAKIYNGAQAMRKIKRLRRDDPTRLAWDIQGILTVDLDDDNAPADVQYTNWEVELMERLSTFRLAQ